MKNIKIKYVMLFVVVVAFGVFLFVMYKKSHFYLERSKDYYAYMQDYNDRIITCKDGIKLAGARGTLSGNLNQAEREQNWWKVRLERSIKKHEYMKSKYEAYVHGSKYPWFVIINDEPLPPLDHVLPPQDLPMPESVLSDPDL